MTKDYDMWIDPKRKAVIVDGQVCLREGQLEMFACPKGSKEHESIVSVNAKRSLCMPPWWPGRSGKAGQFRPRV